MKSHPILRCATLVLAVSLASAIAADPGWWNTRGVKNSSEASNLSPAAIGQAKHMAAMALAELQTKLPPAQYTTLHADVTAIVNLALPQNQAEFDNQRMVLLNGQLKALAKPFYDRLRALDAAWLDAEMAAANIRVVEPGSNPAAYSPYPWSETASDDSNKSPATLGQLKAVFSLRLENIVIDADGDGLPDVWEMQYFSNLSQTGTGDPDGDGLNNATEYTFGFNPAVSDVNTDSDSDGLKDLWEIQYFTNLSQAAAGDPDGDGLSNKLEHDFGFNPMVSNATTDSDGDGLLDVWELSFFANLTQNGSGDPDSDGLTNALERDYGFNPTVSNATTDSDGDGLLDLWEINYFSNLNQIASGDPDNDSLNNLVEMEVGLNPMVSDAGVDSDSDGLPDVWEWSYFSNLSQTASGDPDVDDLNNGLELQFGLNPTVSNAATDSDHDGLPDVWELTYFSNLSATAAGNPDGDEFINIVEKALGLNPTIANTATDTDEDGLPDAWEQHYFSNLLQNADDDPDADGLGNLLEFQMGGDPTDPDTDKDGLADGLEILWGSNPLVIDDPTLPPSLDPDGDGLTNQQEAAAGTNPLVADTDGDGLLDSLDPNPLSPSSTPVTISNALRILTPSRP